MIDLQAHTTHDPETGRETWTQILFGDTEQNAPLFCYEVGKLGCTKIEGKFHGKDGAGLDMYSYVVHFRDGSSREIETTFAVR